MTCEANIIDIAYALYPDQISVMKVSELRALIDDAPAEVWNQALIKAVERGNRSEAIVKGLLSVHRYPGLISMTALHTSMSNPPNHKIVRLLWKYIGVDVDSLVTT